MEPTLRDLRYQADLTPTKVLEELRNRFPEVAPQARSGITNWENQGIRDVRVIRALSAIYNRPFEEVEAAALRCKERFIASRKSVPA